MSELLILIIKGILLISELLMFMSQLSTRETHDIVPGDASLYLAEIRDYLTPRRGTRLIIAYY